MSNTANFYQNSIFWVEVDKIKPNPFQPRREFDEEALRALAESIKQYGVLQALVVTRKEIIKDDGLVVEYELTAGERRLRASKMAGLSQVPVIIRMGEGDENKDDLMKLELAIIENVQREDLNPVERAKAFKKLADQFGFKHHQIAQKTGEKNHTHGHNLLDPIRQTTNNQYNILCMAPQADTWRFFLFYKDRTLFYTILTP